MSAPARRRFGWLITAMLLVAALANLAINPWCARYRSLLVMSGYDWATERDSLPHKLGVQAQLPLSDSGLYPLLVTFNADQEMSHWLNQPVRFTVDYTFAEFVPERGYSAIFDPEDPGYGAYLGAYYLQGMTRPLTESQVAAVTTFDQRALALPALGLDFADTTFTLSQISVASDAFAGQQWVSYSAAVSTNCPNHTPTKFLGSYLQFGTPPTSTSDYPLCGLMAKIYVSYLAEIDLTIGLYVLASGSAEITRLDDQVLRRAEILVR